MVSIDSDLRRRLGRIPAERRAGFLSGLRAATTAPAAVGPGEEWLLRRWNHTRVQRAPATLIELFDEVVARHADRPALADAAGSLTYFDLAAQVDLMAGALGEWGVGPERGVAVHVSRGDKRAIIAILATLRVGGYWLPVDAANPPARTAALLADQRPVVAVVDNHTVAAIAGLPTPVFNLDLPWPEAELAPIVPPLTPRNLAYAIYTSGSTGTPKAVLLEHAGAVQFIQSVQALFQLTPEDHFIQYASLGFDVSVFEIFAALLTGASLWIPSDEERHSIPALTATLRRERVTVVDLPPVILELLDPADFPQLRVAFVGGEAFSGKLTTHWAQGRRFVNGYGPTECTVTVVAKECTGQWNASPPIGRAMDNHVAYALDERMRPVPVGVAGELYIGGAGLARGYAGRPALTAERFVPDPYATEPGGRLYRTGDLVKWTEEGDLVFLGRNDRQVQIRGNRVELGEIEETLLRLRQVHAAVVAAVEEGGTTQLTAYVVGAVVPAALREELARRLPRYMVPRQIIVVPSIPLTANGKTDLVALAACAPTDLDAAGDGEPEDTTDVTFLRLRDECLSIVLDSRLASPESNFFELGGDSIGAIRVLAAVTRVFGVSISLADFFQHPTLGWLAAEVDSAATGTAAAAATGGSDLDTILAELAALSDEEVEAMLGSGHAG